MKKEIRLLLILSVFTISLTQAQIQYKISFNYDSAGNQTLRDRVCANCPSAKASIDSTLVAFEDEKSDVLEDKNNDESGIIAYPNPVTDILTVEWLETENAVKQILLFSTVNQQLYKKAIKPGQRNIELSFKSYPPGMYIVLVIYADNTKQSFQVLKNSLP